jgi:hypothetical protein
VGRQRDRTGWLFPGRARVGSFGGLYGPPPHQWEAFYAATAVRHLWGRASPQPTIG